MAQSLITCTSVSGGRTSSYMALHYPTDWNLFAPVLTRDPACIIRDPSLRQYCQSKVPWFDWDKGGSRELDLTLSNLRDLEQELGKEIQWIAAPFTYDDLILATLDPAVAKAFGRSVTSAMLPNKLMRFCTESLKIYPLAWHCYLHGGGYPVITHIGFRFDEPKRVTGWQCDQTDMTLTCDLVGQFAGKHRHQKVDYRLVRFPLYEDGITKSEVVRFWQKKGWKFPKVSNCDFCFFHRPSEHLHQQSAHPDRAQWWLDLEAQVGATFADRPLESILRDPQLSLFSDDLDQFTCLCSD